MAASLDRSREPPGPRGRDVRALQRPAVIGFVDAAKRITRRGPPPTLTALVEIGVEVRHLALAKRPSLGGVDLLVAGPSDTIAAAECAAGRGIPLLIAAPDELGAIADDLDRLWVASHAMLTVKLDGRRERLVVAECAVGPDGAGVFRVDVDRATAIRRKMVVATADPFGVRERAPTFSDRRVELTVDQDDQGATRLASRSLVKARSSRSGDRLIVNCDAGAYRGIAHEVKIQSTNRLSVVRRDPPRAD